MPALSRSGGPRHDAFMRMPWAKSKGEQLDLLEATAHAFPDLNSIAEPGTEAVAAGEPILPTPIDTLALDEFAGRPLLVAIECLHEDLDNPRTEFPDAWLDELADDIRQRGILQPIVVNPADGSGHHRVHFGAMRLRAAKRAGLRHVPIAARTTTDDPYAQVAENHKRCPLSPLELARFIRCRSDDGDSNSTIATQLGMDQTTIAHHLALLDLPPELEFALKTGRCTSPRTLYELSRLHAKQPERVNALVTGDGEITRSAVSALRSDSKPTCAPIKAAAQHSVSLIEQAHAACGRSEVLVARVSKSGYVDAKTELTALRQRIANLADRLV